MNPVFTGIIEQGKVLLDSPTRYDQKVQSLEGKRIELVLRLQKSQRSLNQNAYYWGVAIKILCDHLGYADDEMHEILKFKFLKTAKAEMEFVKSTAKLSTAEFEEYLEKIKVWAVMELDCYIPDPNME